METGVTHNAIASTIISDNYIQTVHEKAFAFQSWNTINFDDNIIVNLHRSFLDIPKMDQENQEFTFISNDIFQIHEGAFDFLPNVEKLPKFSFKNNSFNETCKCNLTFWLQGIVNSSNVEYILNSSFCRVIDFLSKCYHLGEGLISMKNFTELVCGDNNITCEQYHGETKILDTTAIMLFEDTPQPSRNGIFIAIIISIVVIIVAITGTVAILLMKGGLWLKKKGYCIHFRNMQYNQNENSNDDEGAIVQQIVHHQQERHDLPEELTPELLQDLRKKLENPETQDQAREMIEKLYEMFIIDDSYTNNNRQEEEAHLYEELGNLQNPHIGESLQIDAISLIKSIEKKFNTTPIDDEEDEETVKDKPALVTVYSEPQDAAVHLYSELNNKLQSEDEANKKSSIKSNNSMAFRPLPEKPKNIHEAGPSTKY